MYAGMYWVLSNWRVRPKGAGMYAGMYAYLRTQARGPLGALRVYGCAEPKISLGIGFIMG